METTIERATVHLPEERIEDNLREQIATVATHKAFDAGAIQMMPDAHWGPGGPIGFTMPVQDRVVPNIVGSDIGCGMAWRRLGTITADAWADTEWAHKLDSQIRETIPMGRSVRQEPALHIVDEFPWEVCEEKLDQLLETLGYTRADTPDWFSGYGEAYFKALTHRVSYDMNKAITSLGTLGGGNHFIEFSADTDEHVYVTLHSGSRGIGRAIARHWQDRAHEYTFQKEGSISIPDSEEKYFTHEGSAETLANVQPDGLHIDQQQVRDDYEGEATEGKIGQLRGYLKSGKSEKDELDWLGGTEALGYYLDMIFAQTFAAENRRIMCGEIVDILGATVDSELTGQTVHNYVDFGDGIIRKGAVSAHTDEIAFVPYSMHDGGLLIRGKGNPDWNRSAPHGAGRTMSRNEARDAVDPDDLTQQMADVVTTTVPIEEAPAAYKDTDLIESAIKPTAEITTRLTPLHNIKADE